LVSPWALCGFIQKVEEEFLGLLFERISETGVVPPVIVVIPNADHWAEGAKL
jgi:hypothetical protein